MGHGYEAGDEPVPGYRLDKFLGEGAFGQVWRAVAPGGTETALKIISLSGRQGLKEFRALRLVKGLRHPNLVPIFAYWLKDETGHVLDETAANSAEVEHRQKSPDMSEATTLIVTLRDSPRPVELLIAMGLGEQDLSRRLEECRKQGLPAIPVDELLGYMDDAARAIDYLNDPSLVRGSQGVAVQHCDIKPFNIMIVGGAAQVCDFGLARMLGDVRKTATAAGSIAYVAPECLTNNEPSATTDQYSLAVTYFELRTGKLPYPSESFADVTNAVLKGELKLSLLPPAEQAVIGRATARDPARRFHSTTEMVQALRRAACVRGSNDPGSAPNDSGRRRGTRAVVWTALVAAVCGIAWYAWGPRAGQWRNIFKADDGNA
ncbi:MAG TPA: serine/threonine-protein kinase, partial [Pirellulales bacterium]